MTGAVAEFGRGSESWEQNASVCGVGERYLAKANQKAVVQQQNKETDVQPMSDR